MHLIAAAVLCVAVYWITARLRAGPDGDRRAGRGATTPNWRRRCGVGRRRAAAAGRRGRGRRGRGAGIALTLGVAAPADLSPLLALQLLAAAIAGTRYPLLGAAVIVALAHAPAELTAVLLLAAVALRRVLPERAPRRRGDPGRRRRCRTRPVR